MYKMILLIGIKKKNGCQKMNRLSYTLLLLCANENSELRPACRKEVHMVVVPLLNEA